MAPPYYPAKATAPTLHLHGLGSSPFARRYLGNRGCFLLLRVLRCFSSPGSPPARAGRRGSAPPGFPIRASPDQRLLAAPRGFSQLATPFIASLCQGIHCMPFLAQCHFVAKPALHRLRLSLIALTHGYTLTPTQLRLSKSAPRWTQPRTDLGLLQAVLTSKTLNGLPVLF
jgi:hypothetical protein